MNDLQKMEQEKNVLRWGGLAGILGGDDDVLAVLVVEIPAQGGLREAVDHFLWACSASSKDGRIGS